MIGQLGNIVYDGLKTFGSWSEDQESVIVEHALIGRKPKLEGTGLSLQTLSLDLFLHAEFCKPEEEINKLRNALSTFEILPLLLGNGKVVGEFILQQMSVNRTQMDNQGNLYTATVNLTLKESVTDNKLQQQQQKASDKAFANGNKKPAVKSTRVNTASCNQDTSSKVTALKSYAAVIDSHVRYYTSAAFQNSRLLSDLKSVLKILNTLLETSKIPDSCIEQNKTLSDSIPHSISKATSFKDAVTNNQSNPLLTDIPSVKSENSNFQTAIKTLAAAATLNFQKTATRNG